MAGDIIAGLGFSLSLPGAGRSTLKYGGAAFVSYRNYQIHVMNRNILAKAAQLVNDLEDARAARITLESFIAKNSPQAGKNTGRGAFFDLES